MSLSRPHSATRGPLTGKVIIGMSSPGPDEMTIQELEGKRQLIWDDSTNEEYLTKVRQRAQEKAKEIIMLAELEAEALRATARHEGYEEGLAQAQADVEQHTLVMSQEVEKLLARLGAHGTDIFEARRRDVAALIRLAVEKTLRIEMTQSRKASLESLMREALERIESRRQLVIRCAEEDAAGLDAFLKDIQARNPALKQWTVKPDPALTQGGVVVEADDAKVDNSVATRWKGVEALLDQLAEVVTRDEPAAGGSGE
ncbi:FliH/SctL family protein [Pseudodesulfovibrio pelocollis]|uniref:FliH/SctL family protein n=1 Tax=Pseudodesulfovibrio pelocollis TaxID=3051432 RepID=UPI00255A95E0|nr:FliH/SctL family protein [Pseudodesulfovibrio sp. SB368]